MKEKDLKTIPEDKLKKDAKKMCDSCIHRFYCMAAYKKNHWCGNHKKCK